MAGCLPFIAVRRRARGQTGERKDGGRKYRPEGAESVKRKVGGRRDHKTGGRKAGGRGGVRRKAGGRGDRKIGGRKARERRARGRGERSDRKARGQVGGHKDMYAIGRQPSPWAD